MTSEAIQRQSDYLDSTVGPADPAFLEISARAPEGVLNDALTSLAAADDHGYLPMRPEAYPPALGTEGARDRAASPTAVARGVADGSLGLSAKRSALSNFYRMVQEREVVVKTFTHPEIWPVVLGAGAGAVLFRKRLLGTIIGGVAGYALSRTLGSAFIDEGDDDV